jgi:pimeloyl-ACP methyl ester carboxylesterase
LKNLRKYGNAPYKVAIVHGGPGATGSMAPVATELSDISGILEPLLTSQSVNGQLQELEIILKEHADIPVILAGHSWGAWLVYIFAARYSEMITKLILVGSGPFERKYASGINKTRLNRLIEEEKIKLCALQNALNDPGVKDKDEIFKNLGVLISMTDSFNPLPHECEELIARYDVYQSVWNEANELRNSGKLLRLGKQIHCPVIAIHGDYDPHPHKGVEKPLSRVVRDFRFVLLDNCGHEPWIEKLAKDRFYKILREEI